MSQKISFFRGEYRFLSNFYTIPILMDGVWYPSVEHAFQAAKCVNIRQRKEFASLPTPSDAKRKGGTVDLRPDWEEVKIDVMYTLVLFKFTYHIDLAGKLIDTFPRVLEEGNAWGDMFWGMVNGGGRNELGKVLMAVRSILLDHVITNGEKLK